MAKVRPKSTGKLQEIVQKPLFAVFTGLTGLVLLCCCLTFGSHPIVLDLITFPWTEWLVRDYLEAVVAEDVESAVELVESEGSPEFITVFSCRTSLQASAERDVELLGGAEIRNTDIRIEVNTKSDESVVIAHVEFEYRLADDLEWKLGKRRCWSDYHYALFGRRYLCGCSLPENLE